LWQKDILSLVHCHYQHEETHLSRVANQMISGGCREQWWKQGWQCFCQWGGETCIESQLGCGGDEATWMRGWTLTSQCPMKHCWGGREKSANSIAKWGACVHMGEEGNCLLFWWIRICCGSVTNPEKFNGKLDFRTQLNS
jgi:hypothetical protein